MGMGELAPLVKSQESAVACDLRTGLQSLSHQDRVPPTLTRLGAVGCPLKQEVQGFSHVGGFSQDFEAPSMFDSPCMYKAIKSACKSTINQSINQLISNL